MSLLKMALFLRDLVRGSSAKTAFVGEGDVLAEATRFDAIPPALRARSAPLESAAEDQVAVGRFVDEPSCALLLPVRSAPVHTLVLGATGSGKTRVVLGRLRAKLADLARAPRRADRVCLIDPQGAAVRFLEAEASRIAATLEGEAARRFRERVKVIAPFRTTSSIPLNVFHVADEALEEANAWDLVGLVARLAGAPVGVHQDAFMFAAFLLACELAKRPQNFTLPELMRLLETPRELQRLGRASRHDAVRVYFAETRIAPASLEGVRARLGRLLRLPTRVMFSARTCFSFEAALMEGVTLVDLGGAPLGSSDIAAFFAGFFSARILRAVSARRGDEPQVCLVVDEWQRIVRSAGWLVDAFEDVVATCRARNVRLTLISQSLDAVREVSAALPRIVLSNCDEQMFFRANANDARAAADFFHLTGRRPRPPAPPWETQGRSPFLTAAEERDQFIDGMTRLLPRRFLYVDRTLGEAGALVDAVEIVDPRDPGSAPGVLERTNIRCRHR